jgi:cell wall-associated NlpC family hydrolase
MPCYPLNLRVICGTALLCACGWVLAAPPLPSAQPAEQGDAVLQLLHDRGLLSSSAQNDANAVVRQVRDTASDLVLSAMNFLGVPYRRGGDSAEEGFDCSGFTRHIFELSLGLVLPRRADQQANQAGLLQVARDELKPGDLVFFNTMRRAFSHVGIYVGDGKFIHSPRAGGEVRVEDMRQAYWTKRFNGARRADAAPPQAVDTLLREPAQSSSRP